MKTLKLSMGLAVAASLTFGATKVDVGHRLKESATVLSEIMSASDKSRSEERRVGKEC